MLVVDIVLVSARQTPARSTLASRRDCLQMIPNRPFWLKRRMSGLNGSAVQTNEGCSGWALVNVSNAGLASMSSTTRTPPADRYRQAHSSSNITFRLLCMLSGMNRSIRPRRDSSAGSRRRLVPAIYVHRSTESSGLTAVDRYPTSCPHRSFQAPPV
jgi:hypothetical protein